MQQLRLLSKIENAHPSCSLTTLTALAGFLDVPATSLFRDADIPAWPRRDQAVRRSAR
ncbi:hypothetical protein [Pseudonocardia sp. GCM10023141]|uniref:hypothetical protein n=1 Tax=Pseudonocardia sp. GCM10023141 TaxID=3252653 RepID=UPI003623E27E